MKILNKIILIGGLFVFTNKLTAQSFVSGQYNFGKFVINKEKNFYGYIKDKIGGINGASFRECVAFMTGSKKDSTIELNFLEIEETKIIKKYKGVLVSKPKRKNTYVLKFKEIPNIGICRESTFYFKEDSKEYVVSIRLVKEKIDWIKIILLKEDSFLYEKPNINSKILTKVKYLEGVPIVSESTDFFKVDLDSLSGYIKKESFMKLD